VATSNLNATTLGCSVLAAGVVLALAGCASDGSTAQGEPVNVGLNTLANEQDGADTAGGPTLPDGELPVGNQSVADRVAQQAADLAEMMQQTTAPPTTPLAARPETATPPTASSGTMTDTSGAAQSESASPPAPPASAGTGMGIALGDLLGDEGADSGSASQASDAKVAALADQIEQIVASRVGSSNSPLRDALALIAADLLRPGGPRNDTVIDQRTLDALAPSERQTLAALRASLQEVAASSPEAMAGSLQQAAEKLQQSLGVHIGRVELCSRVDSFGSYVPFAGNDFLSRRSHAALVYVEVERFNHRSLASGDRVNTPGDRWAVDLSQELRLYHKADGRLAWRKPAERVIDTSRNRRRDFYLVTHIELPSTLTVGSYELHVTIKDETTGTSDEFAVPIGVVADPALVTARP